MAAVAVLAFALGALAGSRQGWVEANHSQGSTPPARYKVKQMEDGRFVVHGPYEGYYPLSFKIQEKGECFLGKRQGPWTEFFPNGRTKAKGGYVNGVKAGDWRQWDEEGREITAKEP